MTWESEHGGNLGQQTSLLDVCLLKSHLRKSCPMDHSSTASPNPRKDSPDSGDHTPNLREDEVKILENNLKEWVAADKAKKQTIIQNIADNIKRLPPNRRLKSREWAIKKKVSSLHHILPSSIFCKYIFRPSNSGCTTTAAPAARSGL